MDAKGLAAFKMWQRHRERTKAIQAIFAYPVYEQENSHGIQTGKIIAVLNLDSSDAHSFTALTSDPTFKKINKSMRRLASIASRLTF